MLKIRMVDLPPNRNGKFDVAGIVGEGMFYVIRESGYDMGLYREPYVGSVPIVSGEIAEDFAYYLAKSPNRFRPPFCSAFCCKKTSRS